MTSSEKPETGQSTATGQPNVNRRVFLKMSGASVASVAATNQVSGQEATPPATPAPAASPVTPAEAPPTTAVTFFNPLEAALVEAFTARILPGTPDDPGAREAGVVYFIDLKLAGPSGGYALKTYTQGPFLVVSEAEAPVEQTSRTDIYRVVETQNAELVSRYGFQSILTPQELYRRGLESLEAYAREKFGSSFIDLSEADQDSILEDLDADKATGFDGPTGQAFFRRLRNDTIEGMFSDPLYGGNRDMVGWKLIGYPGARGFYTAQEMMDSNFSAEPVSLADASGHQH